MQCSVSFIVPSAKDGATIAGICNVQFCRSILPVDDHRHLSVPKLFTLPHHAEANKTRNRHTVL